MTTESDYRGRRDLFYSSSSLRHEVVHYKTSLENSVARDRTRRCFFLPPLPFWSLFRCREERVATILLRR